jgi:hypothetical protein
MKILNLFPALLLLSFPAMAQESQIFLTPGTEYNLSNRPTLAPAQDQIFLTPGTEYDNRGAVVQQVLRQRSFATTNKEPAGTVYLSIVHPDYLEPHQFGLQMTKANTTTGCDSYSPIEYEAKYVEEGQYMEVNVKHFRHNISATRHPHFDCDTKSKVVSGLIVLDAKELKRRNVKKIRFNNGQARDTYSVSIMDKAVRLTPDSMIAFKASDSQLKGLDKTYMQYDYADNSIIKLQVPMAEKHDDIAQLVRNLAYENALEPIFQHNTIDVTADPNVFYFRDNLGQVIEKIGNENYIEFGTVNVKRPYDGPYGRMALPVPLKVFLTRSNVTL